MIFGPSDSGAVKSVHETLSKQKVPHEVLKAEDANKRFCALNLPTDYVCVVEEGAGILRASVAVHALQVNFVCTVYSIIEVSNNKCELKPEIIKCEEVSILYEIDPSG